MAVAFCSLMSRAASVMNCSGFCLNFANVPGWMPVSIDAHVRRVSCVFSAISPRRSYLTVDPDVGLVVPDPVHDLVGVPDVE